MTRKHYQLIVDTINETIAQKITTYSELQNETVKEFMGLFVSDLINKLEEDNENFNRAKFLKAIEFDLYQF